VAQSVILAAQEAELGKIMVPGQQGKKKNLPDPLSMGGKSWEWWCSPVIPARAGSIK
jgi:hypothetical protein